MGTWYTRYLNTSDSRESITAYFFAYFQTTILDFSWILTQIVGVEAKHADH